jgi:hypothetical protein
VKEVCECSSISAAENENASLILLLYVSLQSSTVHKIEIVGSSCNCLLAGKRAQKKQSQKFEQERLTCLIGKATPDGNLSKSDSVIPSATITRTTKWAAVLAVPRVSFTGIWKVGVFPVPFTLPRCFSDTRISYRARIRLERPRGWADTEVSSAGRKLSEDLKGRKASLTIQNQSRKVLVGIKGLFVVELASSDERRSGLKSLRRI